MRVLLTGGAGFIGHHVAEHLLRNTDCEIVFLDRLDTSGNLNRICEIKNWDTYKTRCKFVFHDLRAEINSQTDALIGDIDVVLHLAAATHVDRSIDDPMGFVQDNVVGTTNLLLWARKLYYGMPWLAPRFFYFSTDEVFGPAPGTRKFSEYDRYNSGNPYAASKAGAEEMCMAFANTYGMNITITHCMNVFGERQHPEKFIPSTIRKVLHEEVVTIHADFTKTVPGSRFYIHARNVADAVLFLMNRDVKGKFNIVGEKEVDNLTLAAKIADVLNMPLHYEMVDFHSSRPGHDLRYALDGSMLEEMGWKLPASFDESLKKTILWTVENKRWLEGA